MAGIIVLCILATVLALLVTVVWWALGNAWEKNDRRTHSLRPTQRKPGRPRPDHRVIRDP